ncbi:MAG: hypothetical protein IPG44_11685 [Anaerolineales bacterium]|nr:hypothetical protein [Anaerolineales bacterium]
MEDPNLAADSQAHLHPARGRKWNSRLRLVRGRKHHLHNHQRAVFNNACHPNRREHVPILSGEERFPTPEPILRPSGVFIQLKYDSRLNVPGQHNLIVPLALPASETVTSAAQTLD